MTERRHQVVVVGGGFGGLNATRALAKADVDVTVVDGPTTTCSSRCSTRWLQGFCPRVWSRLRCAV
jgi:NADH dehydrogenase FAD-containing subunit